MTNFKRFLRSDLASELVKTNFSKIDEKIERAHVRLSSRQAKQINKRAGNYISFLSPVVIEGERTSFSRLSSAIAKDLCAVIRGKKLLVVGLGNPTLTSDALGPKTVEKLLPNDNLFTFCPLVSGLTGIESFDLCKAIVDVVKPSTVLFIDSLCAAESTRIATVFQLTDTGITPGSGVGNHQKPLNNDTLGVHTLSLGVPLVVYLSTLVWETKGNEDLIKDNLIVSPKEVDILVGNCAEILANAISAAHTIF